MIGSLQDVWPYDFCKATTALSPRTAGNLPMLLVRYCSNSAAASGGSSSSGRPLSTPRHAFTSPSPFVHRRPDW